jgi:hypothetical protein
VASLLLTGVTVNGQMQFVENKGQWDARVNFRGDFTNGSFFLENKGFSVMLHNPEDLQKIGELSHGGTAATADDGVVKGMKPSLNTASNVTLHSHVYRVNFMVERVQQLFYWN